MKTKHRALIHMGHHTLAHSHTQGLLSPYEQPAEYGIGRSIRFSFTTFEERPCLRLYIEDIAISKQRAVIGLTAEYIQVSLEYSGGMSVSGGRRLTRCVHELPFLVFCGLLRPSGFETNHQTLREAIEFVRALAPVVTSKQVDLVFVHNS